MILDYLFLPVLFFIGIVTSYQDFKEGKIKNKWIILGLVWGLGIYLLLLIWAFLNPFLSQVFSREFTFILPSYILKVFINSAIAIIFGYLLWHFDLWSAGDAKLFFVFTLLLPLRYYWWTALPYFPSFVLLINIFIPVLFFLIGQNLFYLFKKAFSFKNIGQIRQTIEYKFLKLKKQFKNNYALYLKTFFGFFLIFMVFQIIRLELADRFGQVGWWQTISFLMIMAVQKSLRRVLEKNWVLILICLGVIFYLTDGYFFYSQEILSKIFLLIKGSMLFMAIFIIASALVSYVQEGQKKHLPFAVWALIGTILTIILRGSVVSLFLNPAAFFK